MAKKKIKLTKKYFNGTAGMQNTTAVNSATTVDTGAVDMQKGATNKAQQQALGNTEAITGGINSTMSTLSPMLNSAVPGLGTGLQVATGIGTAIYSDAYNKQASRAATSGRGGTGLLANNKGLNKIANRFNTAKATEENVKNYGAQQTSFQSEQVPVAKDGIYIKPENKGKFTASAKKAGESVQQHAKSVLADPNATPLQKKRANFARNAASWKHPLGVAGVMIGSQNGLEVPKNMTQPEQVKKAKGTANAKTKVIEIEGKKTPEIHTDKTMTKIKTLGDKPHYKGGTKTVATEGDVVFPTQNSEQKFNKILSLIDRKANGDNKAGKELEKERQKLPSDKSSKAFKGKIVNGDEETIITDQSKNEKVKKEDTINQVVPVPDYILNPVEATSKRGSLDPATDEYTKNLRDVPTNTKSDKGANKVVDKNPIAATTTTTTTTGKKDLSKDSYKSKLLEGATTLPSIYNTVRGLSKPVETTRRFFTPEEQKFQDNYGTLRRDVKDQSAIDERNIRNVSGGSASTYLANRSLAGAERFKRMENIEGRVSAEKNALANQNIAMRNQAKATNLELSNRYDEQDLQNRAARNEFLAAGLEGFSGLSANKLKERNVKDRENTYLNTLTSIYGKKYNEDGTITNKKGNKGVKMTKKTNTKK